MTASKLIRRQEAHLMTEWDSAHRFLRIPTESTRFVYTHPANKLWWDLSGRFKGRQGARLSNEVQGMYHLPFDQLFTEGAYQIGATYERTNINKRIINIGVTLGHNCTAQQYRMIESNWWDSWPPDVPGWLGCHTPYSGWRWTQVQLAKPVDTSMQLDPTAFGNNGFTWDMSLVAATPWWAKTMLRETWTAHKENITKLGYDEHTFHIKNEGNLPAWPIFEYTAPGRAWIQDGMTDNLKACPVLGSADGYCVVNTDASQPTFLGPNDPIDNVFYDTIRQSRILDFFLHNLASLGQPLWQRGGAVRFQSPIPPKTVAHIKVRHDHPGGQVTVMMPQRFARPS